MSAENDHETIHAQLGAYFDGELAIDDERAVLEHVAECETCQAALDDLMGLHVALGRKTAESAPALAPQPVTAPRAEAPIVSLEARRWRRGLAIAGAALAAAAAVVVVVWAPWKAPKGEPRLALADTRPVEVRFSATDFAQHRPYRVDRGGPTVTPIPLATLSALERRSDKGALVAALVWSGDRARAESMLKDLPAEPPVLADRAALAVLARQPEVALEVAEQALLAAPNLAAAKWNRGLALRDLGLPLAAAAELESLAALGEPGWSTEAAERARALREPVEARRKARLDASARRRAAIAGGGPPLTAADVELAPTPARHYFFDALRVVGSAAELDALAPLAAALDRQSGGGECARELARVRGLDLARRAAFAPRYRAVAGRTASPDDVDRLLVDLATAGPAFDDIRLGVILLAGRLRELLPDVEAILATMDNPWFVLLAVQERLIAGRPRPGDVELADRLCTNQAWALRCATIDNYRAMALAALGRAADAERLVQRGLARLEVGGTGVEEASYLGLLSEIRRLRGRFGLSAASRVESMGYQRGDDCKARGFAVGGLAEIARRRGDVARVRELLARPEECAAAIDMMSVTAAVDLALETDEPADRALAEAWIALARTADAEVNWADVGEARLHLRDRADSSRATLRRIVAQPNDEGVIDYAWRSLITGDGERADWKAAFDDTLAALGQAEPRTCAITLAWDDGRRIAAFSDAAGTVSGVAWRVSAAAPALPSGALAGCATTSVVALSPLHGRPPPWKLGAWAWNTGRAAVPSSTRAPEKLVVAATSPPRELLELPELAPVPVPPGVRGLTGADATPSRVAAAMRTATYVELHAHGLVDLDTADGGFIALSPDGDGDWRLTDADVRKLKLEGAPVVVLAACRAAEAAPDQLRRWSLPDAFLAAGARAVIAADVEVPDDLIRAFVDDVRGRLEQGEAPAVAAAAARAALVARDPQSASWVERLMVFE